MSKKLDNCTLRRMQIKKFIIVLISIFSLTVFGVFYFFICEIGIGLSYVKSASAEIQQQMRNEMNNGISDSYQNVYPSKQSVKTSEQKKLKIFGSETPSLCDAKFKEIKNYIDAFFLHIDDQSYLKSHKPSKSSQQQFKEIIQILSLNLPTVTREIDSFEDVSRNAYYFFRVLGKERIIILKDVLSNESDIIEPMTNCFYQWLIYRALDSNQNNIRLSIQQLCGYAGFFLETFGGRSYLFRRSSKVRTLISYYCVLIINTANEEGYNPYGLDIRPHIKLVFESLVQQIGFDYKDRYLDKLVELKKKYHMHSSK